MSDLTAPAPRRRRRRFEVLAVSTVVVLGCLALLLWKLVFVPIPPGHVGALYSLLAGGTVMGRVYPEGLNVKWPWNRFYIFDARVQALPATVDALSLEGLPVSVEITVIFRIEPEKADRLLKEVGPDYVDRLVLPQSIAAVRRYVGRYDTHRLYTLDAETLRAEAVSALRTDRYADLLAYENIVIRRVALPRAVVEAIQEKLAHEQRAAAYEFRLSSQRSEAERLRIEAIGIRTFYSIVGAALTERLLMWRGIEATVELSKSRNTKIVVVGGGKNQLPLILSSDLAKPPEKEEDVPALPPDANPLPDWSKLPRLFDRPADPTDPPKNLGRPGGARESPRKVD